MMLLMFRVDASRYGVDVKAVVEVVPCVPLQRLPNSPASVAGLLNYRGHVVPVMDSARLFGERSVKPCLSSRIIMVRADRMKSGCIGLLAEHVTEALKIDAGRFTDTTIGEGGSSLVDKVVLDEAGMIQHVNTELLVPEELRSFMKSEESGTLEEGPDVL